MTSERPNAPVRPLSPSEISVFKRQLRETAQHLRRTLAGELGDGEQLGYRLAANFLASFPVRPDMVVSGYWPSDNEIDVRPLMISLLQRGARVVLPVIVSKSQPLRFRQWWPGMVMMSGRFGIPVPPDNAPELRPDVVLTPLLAFDRKGHRLGRGSGFYDRTLAQLRTSGRVQAVGVAFAGQELQTVPSHVFDQPLDWVVTEAGALRIGTETTPLQVFGGLRGSKDAR